MKVSVNLPLLFNLWMSEKSKKNQQQQGKFSNFAFNPYILGLILTVIHKMRAYFVRPTIQNLKSGMSFIPYGLFFISVS